VDRLAEKHQVSKEQAMKHVGLSPSSYYFSPTEGRKGRLPSKTTYHEKHGDISNGKVIEQVKNILSEPFQDYWGYHNITAELRETGYHINHKKVYRLMDEARLLRPSTRLRPKPSKRKYVQFRKIETLRPLQYVEMDIKCVWIPEKGKMAYLLTLLDVHTRKVLAYSFDWNMKQDKVIELYAGLIDKGQLPEGAIIRSDNGSQFIATKVREYLAMVGMDQEFTHVATPEENGHVEAYHGILRKELFLRFEYFNFSQAKELIDDFVQYYNNKRRHGSLNRQAPEAFWQKEKHLLERRTKVA
jgi:putative transposase